MNKQYNPVMAAIAEQEVAVCVGINGFSNESSQNGLVHVRAPLSAEVDIVRFSIAQDLAGNIQKPKKPRFIITSAMLTGLQIYDEQAWENFVNQSMPHVARFVISKNIPEEDVLEVANQVFINWYVRIQTIQASGNPTSYFFKTIASECVDYHNKKKDDNERLESLDDPVFISSDGDKVTRDIVSSDFNPEDVILAQERLGNIERAFRSLTDIEQKVLVLATDGLKNKAIGNELGITESTARKRLQKTRKKLKLLLDEQDEAVVSEVEEEKFRVVPPISKDELWNRIIDLKIQRPEDLDNLLNP